jgi:hypothetical protein
MAKRENDPVPTEDYIAQLNWKVRYGRRVSVRFEPKWKYKIIYRFPSVTPLERAVRISLLIGLILVVIYLVASDALIKQVGARIFLGSVFGLIIIIIFFAVRDASKGHKDEPDKTE